MLRGQVARTVRAVRPQFVHVHAEDRVTQIAINNGFDYVGGELCTEQARNNIQLLCAKEQFEGRR